MPARSERRALVIDTPPTSTGNLHIGHLAGPFIAADVYARYLRSTGREVVFSSGTADDRSWHDSRRTLADLGISLDGFAPHDERYEASVLDFVNSLHAKGKFVLRTVRLPYSERTGEYLVEGRVSGYCPFCLVRSRGGLCESCGHPNNFDELIEPRSTVDPADPVVLREVEILVLPMEEYRDALTEFYRQRESRLRPHAVQLVREVLARPLPDFPITYPVSRGIPAPFAETPGQSINPWVEGIPAVMYCSAFAFEQLGEGTRDDDELWRADQDAEVIYFIGFDKVYFWGLTHVALLLAHDGRYVLPDTIVSNELYQTEKLHAGELLAEVPRDLIRFYLTLSAPEHQQTSFDRDELTTVTAQRLVEPWNRLAGLLDKAVAEAGADGVALPVSDASRRRARAVLNRFRACYELPGFSLRRAAELIVAQLDRLLTVAAEPTVDKGLLGELFFEVRTLLAGASPILIDLACAAAGAGGFTCRLDLDPRSVPEVTAFPLPLLG